MEQRITAIEPQEHRKNRRSIFLDGEFALGVDESIVADLGLRVGQAISEDELNAVVRAELVVKAKDRALTLLEYRKRSKAEISRRLKRADFDEDVIEEVVTRLGELGLLDDEDFSQSWVSYRLAGKPMGKTRIRWELRQKGVAEEVAQEALSAIDADTELAAAMSAARSRWEKDRDLDPAVKRRRIASFLQRQGFGWETISKALNGLADDDSEPE